MNIFKGKNLGKYFICLITFILCIFSNLRLYNDLTYENYQEGTVVAKNDVMTTGKYPTQKYIISFNYDNYGVQDINVSFSTWNKLKPGDRATVSYTNNKKGISALISVVLWIIAGMFDICLLIFILTILIIFLINVWEY